MTRLPTLYLTTALLLCAHASQLSAQERAPAPRDIEEIDKPDKKNDSAKKEDAPVHGALKPFQETMYGPLYRYPTFSRPAEIFVVQGLGGAALNTPLLALGSFFVAFGASGSGPGDALVFTGFTSLVFYIPGATLSTYVLGHANGSSASLVWTLLGATAGGAVGTLTTTAALSSNSEAAYGIGLLTLWLFPLAGAIVGYQMSSTWETGQSTSEESPAMSFGIMPTRDGGVTGSLGFRF